MIKHVTLAVSLLSVPTSLAFAGFGAGGGSPPAREKLEQLLLSQTNETAGLFTNEHGKINLGVKGALDPELTISRSALNPSSLKVSESSFDLMSKSVGSNIDTVSIGPDAENLANFSYKIEYGQQLGEVSLKNRRAAARASIANSAFLQ